MNPALLLERTARTFGDRLALRDERGTLTYSELRTRVRDLAAEWSRRGLRRGDRVAALLPNGRDFLQAYFAAATSGVVLVPGNTRLLASDLASSFAHARPALGVVDASFRELAEAASRRAGSPGSWQILGEGSSQTLATGPSVAGAAQPPELFEILRAEDPVHLYYTSGTTGTPKGVVLTAQNVTTHALIAAAELTLSETDVWLHAAPMFHLADAWAVWAITAVGGRHVFLPAFEPEGFWRVALQQAVTITNLVPTMLRRAVRHPPMRPGRSTFRLILSGGAPIAPTEVDRIEEVFGCEYVQTYGLTETSPYLTLSLVPLELAGASEAERQRVRARTGRPVVGIDLRLIDGAGQLVPRDDRTVGEIVVRGPTVSPGYFEAPELTAEAFRDGWFHTGDLAVWDATGSVNIVDRKKDVILSGGENVYSTEVEGVLQAHPAIAEAVVIGIPDEDLGERVCAVVVPDVPARDFDVEAILQWCRDRLAGFKRPRQIDVVGVLPRTGSGKLDKRGLRERYWRG